MHLHPVTKSSPRRPAPARLDRGTTIAPPRHTAAPPGWLQEEQAAPPRGEIVDYRKGLPALSTRLIAVKEVPRPFLPILWHLDLPRLQCRPIRYRAGEPGGVPRRVPSPGRLLCRKIRASAAGIAVCRGGNAGRDRASNHMGRTAVPGTWKEAGCTAFCVASQSASKASL